MKTTQGGKFTNRTQTGLAPKPETTLVNQPRFIQLEYRIIAVIGSGVSEPSNLVAVVL